MTKIPSISSEAVKDFIVSGKPVTVFKSHTNETGGSVVSFKDEAGNSATQHTPQFGKPRFYVHCENGFIPTEAKVKEAIDYLKGKASPTDNRFTAFWEIVKLSEWKTHTAPGPNALEKMCRNGAKR